jgi:uncharacterized protein GlcG (DUF336 family)
MTEPAAQTPPAWKAGNLSYGTGLTIDTAKKMLGAGEKEAKKQGVPMAIAIVDAGGNLLAFHRMDNAILVGTQIAMDKAFTAVFGKQHSGNYASLYQSGILIPLFYHERWITFPGGFPIIKNGAVLGGIGVSGGTIEDVFVARAALKAGGFSIDEVDAFLAQIGAMRKE